MLLFEALTFAKQATLSAGFAVIEMHTAHGTVNWSRKLDQNIVFFFLLKVFLLTPPLSVTKGDNVNVSFSMVRSKENHRLMDMEFTYELHELSGRKHPAVKTKMYLE